MKELMRGLSGGVFEELFSGINDTIQFTILKQNIWWFFVEDSAMF